MINHSNRKDGAWTRFEFEYDEANDLYTCPEGFALKQFRRNYSDPNRGKNISGSRKYRALKSDCQSCPSKEKCCPNEICRSIRREAHEHARDFARSSRKTQAYKVSRDKRKKVEMLFAHLNRILNLTRLRLCGPNGAKDEFLLVVIAQNLRKVAKLRPKTVQPEAMA